jgi:hypothetical protein
VRRRASLRRRPPAAAAACAGPGPCDEHPVIQIVPSLPVKPSPRSTRPYPAALNPGRWILIQRIRSAPSAYPRAFANKALTFSKIATRSSHLKKPLRIGPIFFSLARKLKVLYRLVLKFVLAITSSF